MMVLRETPVAAATAVTPPRPSTLASTATSRRPWRTSSAARITPHRRAIGEASVMPRSLNGHVQMNYLFFNDPKQWSHLRGKAGRKNWPIELKGP